MVEEAAGNGPVENGVLVLHHVHHGDGGRARLLNGLNQWGVLPDVRQQLVETVDVHRLHHQGGYVDGFATGYILAPACTVINLTNSVLEKPRDNNRGVDESGLELRDTESLPEQAHKQLDKNSKSRQRKTDRLRDEERQVDRQGGGQARQEDWRAGETDRLEGNQSD
ncbi:hypothetical protein F7725_022427 [Dissostichus mawsoni]|uniref:Uncharacterized protein n=1 Tax=Dissostichus mawsoni TaxID=36200 RepID=A0A7J5YXS7_DISMA|nr:hypothetical protein F7725_022427 [Dissostichus mawsoni]